MVINVGKILFFIENKLDDFQVKQKLRLLYICCVLIPLILTDSIVLTILFRGEQAERFHTMENTAAAVEYNLSLTVEEIVASKNKVFINRRINEFLNEEYTDQLDFVTARYELLENAFFDISFQSGNSRTVFYADNETIVNGGYFFRLSTAKEQEWYWHFVETGRNETLYFYYSWDPRSAIATQRRISYIKRLDYFQDSVSSLIKYDINYNSLARVINNLNFNMPVYICVGDLIVFSNVGNSKYTEEYERLTGKEDIGLEKQVTLYGQPIRIMVLDTNDTILDRIGAHLPLIIFLIAMNSLLPWLLMQIINRSFTSRLGELSHAFDAFTGNSLTAIEAVRGKDEIGSLMHNYNGMVGKFREMIKTIYQDRLEKQEMDLARKNAELLALHSQINPHFLFNVLESIRMRSILRGERETALMIEKLALLERQNVNWSSDCVMIREEMSFIEAYLDLQKYRFDDRLHFEIHLDQDCETFYLPKLTLVTFVENACVHGVENKAVPCWVYVRVYRKEDWLYLEVEDTGDGMPEDLIAGIMEKIQDSSMAALMDGTHVGIINACLRLKMITEGNVTFELESEKGVGTFITIRILISRLPGKDKDNNYVSRNGS